MKHSNRTLFALMVHFYVVIHLKHVYHLEKPPGIVSINVYLAIAKITDSQQIIAFNKSFVLHYSINKKNKSYSGILLWIISN